MNDHFQMLHFSAIHYDAMRSYVDHVVRTQSRIKWAPLSSRLATIASIHAIVTGSDEYPDPGLTRLCALHNSASI